MLSRLSIGLAVAFAAAGFAAVVPATRPPQPAHARWKSYRSEAYGLALRYPPELILREEGPDTYEMQLRHGKGISGTQAPLLDTIDLRTRAGLPVLTIEVPDQKNFPVVAPDGGWWLRACGEEGFATLASRKPGEFAGYPALRVASIANFENPRRERTFFLCVNAPWQPFILYYQERLATPAEKILATVRLRRPP